MLKYIKIYSIDISLGAVITTWFLARVVLIDLPWFIYLLIGLAVWSIYTLDHLLDARSLENEQEPPRYSYHRKYYYLLSGFLVIAISTTVVLAIFFLPEGLLIQGLSLAGIVISYFIMRLFLKKLFAGFKEFVAAAVYTTGIALPAYFYYDSGSFFLAMVVLQLFCMVFANLLICSMWDEEIDKLTSSDSMTMAFGRKFINLITLFLIGISIVSSAMAVFIFQEHYLKIQLIILFMNVFLLLVYFFAERTSEHVRRLLIDSIFFIPLLLLLL